MSGGSHSGAKAFDALSGFEAFQQLGRTGKTTIAEAQQQKKQTCCQQREQGINDNFLYSNIVLLHKTAENAEPYSPS